jgi:2-oxoglutarate ferredoxin oxidoreductase subunit delta
MKVSGINISKSLCKGCSICIDVCPKNTLKLSGEINEYGQFYPEVGDLKTCIGCRLCELYCPDFAIEVNTE